MPRVRPEGLDAVLDVALVRRDLLRLPVGPLGVPQVEVVVGVAAGLEQGDPAAVLEQLIPRRVGALGHLAERPGNLGDVLTVERRTEAEWRCCHNDGAVLC